MTPTQYQGVNNLQGMFDALSNERIAWAFRRRELKDIALMVGITLPRGYIRETDMVELIRAALRSPETAFVPCECAGRGRRWEKADIGEAVTVMIDPNVDVLYGSASRLIEERFHFVASHTDRLRYEILEFDPNAPIAPDIYFHANEIDGAGGTLGVTSYYVSDTSEDLDLFGDEQPSVRIALDWDDRGSSDFLRTVTAHEIVHGAGVDHIEIPGNLMQPFYVGTMLHLGPDDIAALQHLYGAPRVLAA